MNKKAVITEMWEVAQRIQLTNVTRFCAMKVMMCSEQAKVFNVFEPESMKPGFDIYLDVGLADLAMTIEASRSKPKKEKKKKKRFKLQQLIAMAASKRKNKFSDSEIDGTLSDTNGLLRLTNMKENIPETNEEATQTEVDSSWQGQLQMSPDQMAYDDTVHIFLPQKSEELSNSI